LTQWTPRDGYFATLLAALFGRATFRSDGRQDTGGASGMAAGQIVSADAALKLSAVFACIRLRAQAVGAMPIRIWNINRDGTRTRNTDHWLNTLFRQPNQYQTRNEFFETVMINFDLHGNFYGLKTERANREVTSIVPIMAHQVEVHAKDDLTTERNYIVTRGVKKDDVSQRRMWHVPLMPSTGLVGLSPLQYAARTMGIGIAAEDRVATLAANGFKPTGVLMIDKVLKPEQRTQIRGQFDDLQEGKGDPLKVLEAGMKYQQISMNPKDVQLLETRKFSIEDIARFFDVPSVLINDTSATTVWGSGISEIKEGFYTLALQPVLEKLEASITRWLLLPSERDKIEVEFDFSRFLRGNESTRTSTLVAAISGLLLTIDEARAKEGLPPLPDDKGAVMYAQSQMIPIGSETEDDDEPQPTED
jgi:HK97 family phage portal protein